MNAKVIQRMEGLIADWNRLHSQGSLVLSSMDSIREQQEAAIGLSQQQGRRNKATDPQFLETNRDVSHRLVQSLYEVMHESVGVMTHKCDEMLSVVNAMQVLARDALSKQSEYWMWIDALMSGYRRETLCKFEVIDQLDLHSIRVSLARWEVMEFMDYRLETAMHDSLSLAQ